MFSLLENCLKLILSFLLILTILTTSGTWLLMMMSVTPLKTIPIVLALLNASLNPKNLMALDLNLLILNLLNILFPCFLSCVSLSFGLLLLALTILEINLLIVLKSVMYTDTRESMLLDFILFSTLASLFLIVAIIIMLILN